MLGQLDGSGLLQPGEIAEDLLSLHSQALIQYVLHTVNCKSPRSHERSDTKR
jgi:hypothetical protein